MAFDCAIVLAALSVVGWSQIAWSIVGAVALNLTLAINHRPGRYMAVCSGRQRWMADSAP
jgi:uncharacterized membrane-anchored protein YitT (DUF2179 family)